MKPLTPNGASQNHLILMVKTPKIGTVKTRLAKDIGSVKATNFYRTTANRLITQLSHDPRWKTFIAIAPMSTINHWPWPHRAIRESQNNGDLGARMQTLFEKHSPNPTLIIGTDIPAITPQAVNKAFKALNSNGFVLGPSGDGGYWCVGQKNTPKTINAFNNVRWSSEHTYSDTKKNLPENKQSSFPLIIEDIDTGNDYKTHYKSTAGRWL